MKAIYGILLFLSVVTAFAQGAPPPLNLTNPASFGTKDACLSDCDKVFADCKVQCKNTGARLDEPHYEGPDLPVDPCIRDCAANFELCRGDC